MSALPPRLPFRLKNAAPWATRGGLVGLIAGGAAVQFNGFACVPALQSALDSPALLIAGGVVGLVPAIAVFAALVKNAPWDVHLFALWDGPLIYLVPSLLLVATTALVAPYLVGAALGFVACATAAGAAAFLVQDVRRDTPMRSVPPAPTAPPGTTGSRKTVLGLPNWAWAVLLVAAAVGSVARIRARNEVAHERQASRTTSPSPGAGGRFMGTVEGLTANPAAVTDAELEGGTDEDVKKLAPLTGLTRLSLKHARVTDAGLRELTPLIRLTGLDLFGCAVTDAGLRHLAPLTALTALNLGNTQVTDAGLKYLAPLTRLADLNVSSCGVTDAGARDVARLTALTRLDLRCPGITDEGIKRLAPLTHLRSLRLSGPRITDAGVKDLVRFTGLLALDLDAPRVTPAALERLRAELPFCIINGVVRNAPAWGDPGPGARPPVRGFP